MLKQIQLFVIIICCFLLMPSLSSAKNDTELSQQTGELLALKAVENEVKIYYEKIIAEKEAARGYAEKSASKFETFQNILSLSVTIISCAAAVIIFLCGIIGYYYRKEIKTNANEITSLSVKVGKQKQLITQIETIIDGSSSLRKTINGDPINFSNIPTQLRELQGSAQIYIFLPPAILAYNERSWGDAEILWGIVCRAEPDNANWRMVYGIILYNQGKMALSIEALDESLEKNPNNARCHSVRALAFEELDPSEQDWKTTIIDIDESISKFSNFAVYYYFAKIKILGKLSDGEEIINAIENLLKIVKNDHENKKNLYLEIIQLKDNDKISPEYRSRLAELENETKTNI